jgi:thiol:disulfide interchange protein
VKKRFLTACILLVMAVTAGSQSSAPNSAPRESHLNWRPWSDAVFVEARRGHRFVLLDLEAVWCHWCHVMDANTYSDPEVIKLLQAHYITVKWIKTPARISRTATKITAGRRQSFSMAMATRL